MELTQENIKLKRQALANQIKAAQVELAELEQLETLAAKLFPINQTITPSTGIIGLTGGAAASASVRADLSVINGTGSVVSKRTRILDAVAEILSDGKRRTSRELIPELSARGVHVGGADPVNNLGAYLSPVKTRFNSIRKKGGWGLIPAKKTSPSDAPTSKGLFPNGSAEGHQVAG